MFFIFILYNIVDKQILLAVKYIPYFFGLKIFFTSFENFFSYMSIVWNKINLKKYNLTS